MPVDSVGTYQLPSATRLEFGALPFPSGDDGHYQFHIDSWAEAHYHSLHKESMDALTPAQQEQFKTVLEVIHRGGDTEAEAALMALFQRKDRPLAQGDLLASLERLATDEMGAGLVKKGNTDDLHARLVSDLVKQIENPELIAQSVGVDTCGEASMERYLAVTDPAGYARLVADLASKHVETHWNGERIFASTVGFDSLSDNRSMASNLFQHSWHTTFSNPSHRDGLPAERYGQQLNTLNPDFEFVTLAPERAAAAIGELALGGVVLMALDGAPAHETHAVVFEGYDQRTGEVLLWDPLQGSVAMSRADFERNIRGAALPKGHGIADADLQLEVGYGGGEQLTGAFQRRRR